MLACNRSVICGVASAAVRLLRRNNVVGSSPVRRCLSTQTDGEVRIAKILKDKFPAASSLRVVDISGGCGAMYEIHIESSEFEGKRTVQQHQLVNQLFSTGTQG
ncbi:hypothetical protein Q5P01_006688 [Channa striata]|uniref:BolA-like protein 3 n=1 Tax=Channa striata TaxID=64152 RepID=A0AA88SX69_CHASR|nr:hypothetical protein Q5P01_006688 [Channa striata]